MVPNRMVEAQYNASLVQEKIFNHVLYQCQDKIDQARKTKVWQPKMFGIEDRQELVIKIQCRDIGKPENYPHIIKSAIKMMRLTVTIPHKGDHKREYMEYCGLFSRVIDPKADGMEIRERFNYFHVAIDVEVARHIFSIDTRHKGWKDGVEVLEPFNYTTFMYEHCMNAECKYTARIYKLLCSYKMRGKLKISVDELRAHLDLGKRYPNPEAFIRKVIIPVEKELKGEGTALNGMSADIWFSSADTSFFIREGKKVIGFNFKIFNRNSAAKAATDKQHIINLLKTEFKFRQQDLNTIEYMLEAPSVYDSLMDKLGEVLHEYKTRRGEQDEIKNLPGYTIVSLRKLLDGVLIQK